MPLQPIPVQLNGRCLGFVAVAVPRVPALLRAGDSSLPIRDVRLVQADGAPAEGSLALSQVGKRDLRVEATLVVASNQPRRTYRGQIDLTMTYN